MRNFKIKFRLSTKLIASHLAVLLIIGISATIVGVWIIDEQIVGQAREQVRNDMKTADFIYKGNINTIHLFTKHLASLPYIKEAVLTYNRPLLLNKFQEVKKELNLDILNITDAGGYVIARAANPAMYGDSVSSDIFIEQALKNQTSYAGSDIITREHLLREGQSLADQAFINLVETPHARKKADLSESRGLVLKAAAPILYNGRLIGIIYGAKLINKNYEIVDQIKSLVFKDEKLDGYDYGTSTIFLDDLRVSTNVQKNGVRAIGTRVSEEVYRQVFRQDSVWLGKAFVVNNWYISAYNPIKNINNEVIGILYVGILEKKYTLMKQKLTFSFFKVIALLSPLAIMLAILMIQGIINPVKTLVSASKEIAEGNYNVNISVKSTDELGYLCKAFNTMVGAIVERDNMLKEDTQRQMIQSEKLASLGKLAAGIAHEINNPLTGVLTYSSMLLEELKDTDYREDLDIIVNETLRCRKIVREILNFARETRIEKEQANINQVLSETLLILEKHVSFHNITINRQFDEKIPLMSIDINQMKSVFNNLAVNAADAMSDGGVLTIATHYHDDTGRITIEVSDTGHGIPEKNLLKIFDPFFTTKQTGKGTGLGLSVTYGIIKRHNGTISVKSTINEGTTFTIELPVA